MPELRAADVALVAAPNATELAACAATLADATHVVVLGGDGLLLETLHRLLDVNPTAAVYGINFGSVGFLANHDRDQLDLATVLRRMQAARPVELALLEAHVTNADGEQTICAVNEVALLRQSAQTAHLQVTVDGQIRLANLIGDGALVATPAGSTAYNLSAHGPVLPLDANLLALTPICPFRPRRWPGALLPHRARVTFDVLEPGKRPVSVTADQAEIRDVQKVEIAVATQHLTLLFDPHEDLMDRVAAEQFDVWS